MSLAPVTQEVTATGGDLAPDLPWITIVWNDPVNLMSYVTYVVANGTREAMEADTEALQGYGLWATFQKDS